jgi:hypothetical protein
MKKILYFAVAVALLCVFSCKQKAKTTEEAREEFRASLTENDTLEMLKLGDQCMELLKKKDIESAMTMLYEYDDSTQSVQPLSDATRKRYEHIFKIFPVLDYIRTEYTFFVEGINNLKYDIIFAEEEHPEVNGVPKTSFMFNPVKIDGQWYLTVKRADQDIGRDE